MSLDLFAIIGIVLVFMLLGVLLIIPGGKGSSRKRKPHAQEEQKPEKDWQKVSLKLEKHIYELREQLEEAQKREKALSRDVLIHQEKYARLQEKSSQERKWQQKEEQDSDRQVKEFKRLKEDLQKAESTMEENHRARLILERESEELKRSLVGLKNDKIGLEAQVAKLEALSDTLRKELMELREMNKKLSKKQEETTFVSRVEFEKVQEQLKAAQKEVERLRHQRS